MLKGHLSRALQLYSFIALGAVPGQNVPETNQEGKSCTMKMCTGKWSESIWHHYFMYGKLNLHNDLC